MFGVELQVSRCECHLEGKLATIHNSSHKGVCGCSQVLLGPLPGCQQLLQDFRQNALGAVRSHKAVTCRCSDHVLLGQLMQPASKQCTASAVSPHGARVQLLHARVKCLGPHAASMQMMPSFNVYNVFKCMMLHAGKLVSLPPILRVSCNPAFE